MPKKISLYKIFIASPSDVLDERMAVKDVINELNQSYAPQNNLFLELVGWESHSAPGISNNSVQDIINNDINLDYDLFLGLIWKKFGTPTATANSGTEEEFNQAYQKYINDNKSLQILFYFKIASAQSLNDIDPNQLLKVNTFKQKIEKLNALFREFNSISELQGYLRLHIPKRINDLIKSNENQNLVEAPMNIVPFEDDEELGILDYEDIRDDNFSEATNSLSRITEATTWIADKLREKSDEINKLRTTKPELSNKEIRDYSSRVATNLDDYANRIDPEITIFINAFEKAGNAIQNIYNLRKYQNGNKESDLELLDELVKGNNGSKDSMAGFLNSVIDLPRISKELNRARRNVEDKLSALISKLDYSGNIIEEIRQSLLKMG